MKRLWQGNVNAWECDELGHMNVMPYVTKALSALGRMSEELGMRSAFSRTATASLAVKSIQIRYLTEARAGAALYIDGGILDYNETSARLILIMTHALTEKTAATIRFSVDHIEPRSRRVFAWPEHLKTPLESHRVEAPDVATPRGLKFETTGDDINLERADALGLKLIGMGQFQPQDMDVFGCLRPEQVVGRVSDSVIHFTEAFPEETEAHLQDGDLAYGGILLEANVHLHAQPNAGQSYVIRSGLVDVTPNVRHLVHWGLDPVSGHALWTMEGIAGIMDLKARRLVKLDSDRLKSIHALTIHELTA